MEDFVTYEQAVKLRELGFNWPCGHYYKSSELKASFDVVAENEIYSYEISTDNLTENFNSYNEVHQDISSAPTLAQAQKWLREKHYLFIEVYSSLDENSNWEWDSFVKNLNNTLVDEIDDTSISHQTYEQALSAGIDKALELLKQNNNGNQD